MQHDGQELLARPYAKRRALLENLFSEPALTAPWALCPMTTDLATAREWPQSWTGVSGVEGIVVKPLNSRYLGRARFTIALNTTRAGSSRWRASAGNSRRTRWRHGPPSVTRAVATLERLVDSVYPLPYSP